MVVILENLLAGDRLAFVEHVVATGRWNDGAATADTGARSVKRNLELDGRGSAEVERAQATVYQALAECQELSDFALPARWSRPIFSRYDPGMEYGRHVDNPMLGGAGGAMRTDVSVTVFLSDPATYEGGELELEIAGQTRLVKLAPGSAVAYVTGTPHRVRPVVSGARVAAVCWAQSVIADPHKRAIMWRFHKLHHRLSDQPEAPLSQGDRDAFLEAYYDLFRLWADPA